MNFRIKSISLCSISFLLSACQLFRTKADVHIDHSQNGKYPSVWWEKIVVAEPPAWEVFPHQALAGEVILSKRNELGILSNFAATSFVFKGKKYASVEGFWQMLKYPDDQLVGDPRDVNRDELKGSVSQKSLNGNTVRYQSNITWSYRRDEVAMMSSFQAKDAGKKASENMKLLGIDWVSFDGKKMNYKENAKGEFYQLIKDVMLTKLQQNPEVKNILLKTGDLTLRPDHIQEAGSAPAWKYHEIWMEIRSELQKK